jgi:nickel/cobalt exporter
LLHLRQHWRLPGGFAAPKEYRVELDSDRLVLQFTLPLAQPFLTKSALRVEVYDPSYYLAVSLRGGDAVALVGAPAACRPTVRPATGPSVKAAALLATLGADQRELPPEMKRLTRGIDNSVVRHDGRHHHA